MMRSVPHCEASPNVVPCGPGQRFHALDVHQPRVRVEPGRRDRLLVEVDARSRAVAKGEARNCAAAHDHVGAARFDPAERQAGNLAEIVVQLLEALGRGWFRRSTR